MFNIASQPIDIATESWFVGKDAVKPSEIFVIIHINKGSEFFALTCCHFSFFYLCNAKKLNFKNECGAPRDAWL